jgi:hypothetical protein
VQHELRVMIEQEGQFLKKMVVVVELFCQKFVLLIIEAMKYLVVIVLR